MTDTVTCPRCTSPVAAGARFCSVCGASVAAPGEVVEDQLLARLRQATLGEYDVLRELGRGGMAAVYLAWDRELARYVAIKVLLPELAYQATMSQRFLQEARTAANLDDHPSVVRVYRAKESQGLRYFVMKYVDGCTLDQLLRAVGPLPVDLAAHVVDQVALALQYAHDHGVVHRDVKPGNVLVDRTGGVVVTDFGIAKIAEGDQLTRTGFAIGTPHYMAPEQWRVEALTPAADQYALGVVAYHALTGALPFEGTHYEIQEHHLRSDPPPVDVRRPGVPPELAAVVALMLGKRPELRFPDLRSVSQALGAVPRDPAPVLRERLSRLIPTAPPSASGDPAVTSGGAGDHAMPGSFLRPTPYTPGNSLPPVIPASPTPWQPAAGGYTPYAAPAGPAAGGPGAEGGVRPAGGVPASPPAGAVAAGTPGAGAAELTPPEVVTAAVAAPVSPVSPVDPDAHERPPAGGPSVGGPSAGGPAAETPAGDAPAVVRPARPVAAYAPPPAAAAAAPSTAGPGTSHPEPQERAPATDAFGTGDVPRVLTRADVPAPPERPRRRLPLVAVGGALAAVAAAGVLATRGGERRSAAPASAAPRDTVAATPAPSAPAAAPASDGGAATPAPDTAAVAAVAGAPAAPASAAAAPIDTTGPIVVTARDTTARIPAALIITGVPTNAPITLAQGDSVRLVSTVVNARRQRLSRATVTYTSSDPTRAVRRASQYLVALAPGGPVTVTASSGRLRSAVQVVVTPRGRAGDAGGALAAPTEADARAAFDELAAVLRGRNPDAIVRRLGETAADGSPTRAFAEWVRDARGFAVEQAAFGRPGGDGETRSVAVSARLRYTRGGLIKTAGFMNAEFHLGLRHGAAGWRPYSFRLARRVTP